jgi:hypothetical protein
LYSLSRRTVDSVLLSKKQYKNAIKIWSLTKMSTEPEKKFSGWNRTGKIIVVLSLGLDETGKRFAKIKSDKNTDNAISITKISDSQWELLKVAFSSSSWILIVSDRSNPNFEDSQNFDDTIMEVLPRELPTLPGAQERTSPKLK